MNFELAMKKTLYFIWSSRSRECITMLKQMCIDTGSHTGESTVHIYIVQKGKLNAYYAGGDIQDIIEEYGEEVILPRFKKGDPVMFKTKSGLWSFGVYHSEGRVDAVIYDKVKTFTCTHMIEFDKFTTNDQLKNIHNSLKTNKNER